MSSSVHLHTHNPDGTSRVFDLTEHDTFLLGRMKDCHLCLPDDPKSPATISCSMPARRKPPCATSAA